jgi:putative thioredoxin
MAYVDVTDAMFEAEVVAKSAEVPVVVDLWAPWCGPCRTLGPLIERVIDATEGRVVLVKVNVDENPRISQAFQVQSIPAVFAIKDRKVIDSFVGAIPEAQIKSWVSKFAPAKSAADTLIDQGLALGQRDLLEQALEIEPGNARGVVALAERMVADGENEAALALLARIPETAEVIRVAALARIGTPADSAQELLVELESLLPQVKADEVARQRYVDLLEVMADDPRVPGLRRKLTAQLF